VQADIRPSRVRRSVIATPITSERRQHAAADPTADAGPFYRQSFPQDADNDLVHVAGHQGAARGSITRITGRILDLNGRPVTGARVEIWQCGTNGRYHYVRDGRADQPRDENFQGYGATTLI
jgi:protocatechuate 3,4-dioxygenase, beta subunit